jgi:hypothetical protein
MKELTNRIPNPSCLIYKMRMDEENKELGILEFWSDRNPQKGDVILSNQSVQLKLKDVDFYYQFRDFVVEDIIDVRDFRGDWDVDKERKNDKTYFTARVIPTQRWVDVATRAYDKAQQEKRIKKSYRK